MRNALAILGHHRRAIEGGPRSRRQWARPRTLEEVRDSLLGKLEAIEGARRRKGTRAGRLTTARITVK